MDPGCNPGRREARKADRRRAILEVAERAFLERGFADTSMSTIAAELGGSKTTLWSYFPSKDDLFAAVLDAKISDFQQALDGALLHGDSIEASLTRFGGILLRKMLSPLSVALHRLIVAEAERFPWIGRAFADRGPDRVRERLARYIGEEMEAGRLRRGDPMLAARQFIALCQAGCYLDRLWRPGVAQLADPDTEVEARGKELHGRLGTGDNMNEADLVVVPVGNNDTLLWGMTSAERLRRIVAAQGLRLGAAGDGPALLVDLGYAFDPAWLRIMAGRPGFAVTRGGVPVIAHVTPEAPDPAALTPIVQEEAEIENHALRKRERPFMEQLTPATVPAIERASYVGSYKGVTDILTKYLWPEWAFHLTRLAARWHLSPNQVTAIGAVFCILATIAFWYGFYWIGLAAGLIMMVLDTVDGKLARCTITSSWWGNVFDHGIDLVHPPFWWFAWGAGLDNYGLALPADIFWACMVAIVGGYVVQRAIEGAFIGMFGIHIHVWRRFDSQFRLITARRNPNMPILLAFLIIGRPDWGLEAVAIWTIVSLLVHLVQLGQAFVLRARGRAIVSWLA